MRVLLLTYGVRGEVEPFVALGRALRESGHEAVLAGPAPFAPFAAEHGVEFAALDAGLAAGLRDTVTGGRGVLRRMSLVRTLASGGPALRRVLDDAWDAAREVRPDVVVHHAFPMAGRHLAERLDVPGVLLTLDPMYLPTGEFPNPLYPAPAGLPRRLNRATYELPALAWRVTAPTVGRWRRESLRLPPERGRRGAPRRAAAGARLVLNAVSRHVLPPAADWPPTVRTIGYLRLPPPPGWRPPAALAAFLAAGEPPVCVGFGSAVGRDPGASGRTVAEAVARAGVRAVVVGGAGGIRVGGPGTDERRLCFVDEVPYEWLLPRVSAVVHHGGGTTTPAAASGRPQVLCPFGGDQPSWARRLHRIGVAPAPLPQSRLTAAGLAAALREALGDPGIRRRAAELGRRVRGEDAGAAAVAELAGLRARGRPLPASEQQ
ncbi:glycosyltransferase [Actinomadura sp. WMMB 499]|uniref:glycosyltransferase n=1 Tax=Actinomadura sp. WMMB 499 TaxID=1219491 RepID=UPI001244644D|nr:glycosyltransferase [Actinomadura sp. WMMB 499]QFG22944.1 glycosyltransferase family 1 protein [Actinomadura sp. WMMB 499]